jgi:hypothetical protein
LLKLLLVFAEFDHNIGFWEQRQLFRQKIGKNRWQLWSYLDPGADVIISKTFWAIFCQAIRKKFWYFE